MSLADFSDDQLLEELVRRRNARAAEAPKPWCHECRHWKAWGDYRREPPDSFNPCSRGHAMAFEMPPADEMPHEDNHGFYRLVCADRAAPVPPAPRALPTCARPRGIPRS